MYAHQGEIRLMTETRSPDMDILALAQLASTATEYTLLITEITNGSALSGPLSEYKPIADPMTIQQYDSGQLIITNTQRKTGYTLGVI